MWWLLAGCVPCLQPQTVLNAVEFDMLGTLSTHRTQPEDAAFPTDLPANGPSTWVMLWDSTTVGPVNLDIDGQIFVGEGSWSQTECGNFDLEFGGEYLGADGGRHFFTASGEWNTYDGVVDGLSSWQESWQRSDGGEGTLTATVVFHGKSGTIGGN